LVLLSPLSLFATPSFVRARERAQAPSPTMGMSLSKVFANLFGKKEMRILMVGLDGTRCGRGGFR